MGRDKTWLIIGALLLLLLFVLLISIFLNYFSYTLSKERMNSKHVQIKSDELDMTAVILRKTILDTGRALVSRSLALNTQNYSKDHMDVHLRSSFLEFLYSRPFVTDVSYINKDGISEIVVPDSAEKGGMNYSAEGFFSKLRNGETLVMEEQEGNGAVTIRIAVPVLSAPDQELSAFAGAFMATINGSSFFDSVLAPMNSEKGASYTALLASDGAILYHYNPSFIGKNYNEVVDRNTYPDLWHLINRSLKEERGYGQFTFSEHKKGPYANMTNVKKIMVYASVDLNERGWTLHSLTPLAEIEQEMGIGRLRLLFIFNTFIYVIIFFIAASGLFMLCRHKMH